MKISFKLKAVNTADTGEIVEVQDISAQVFNRLTIDETVGDEFFIKSSDIILEILGVLPQINRLPVGNNWIAVYVNDLLFNVYQHPGPANYVEYNQKNGVYKYRLYAIQKVFYDHLKSTILQYSTDAHAWNYDLADAILTIDEISVENDTGTPVTTSDRAGFSLGDMLNVLVTHDNYYGYKINSMTTPIPTTNDNDLPIIWRGLSIDVGDTNENKINLNFYENGADIFHTTWMDILKLAIFGWNAFVRVRPTFANDDLSIDVSLIPKANADLATPIENVQWLERTRVPKKYQLDGIQLSGENFEYTQGEVEGANVFSRSIEISDYDEPIANHSLKLYWAAGDYNGGTGKYELTAPYFASGLVEINYDNIISLGNGFEGKAMLIYEDGGAEQVLQVLDQILIGEETIQLNTMRADASGKASIEGIVIG